MAANMEIRSSILKSHLFDKELIENGDWDPQWKTKFEAWNEEGFPEHQKEIALEIMKSVIVDLLKKDCVPKGRVKIDRLGNMLDKLEQLLISTKTLDNKYYRDHLNHSIRVILLSKLMARYEPFKLTQKEVDMLVLSCAFHDLSYPLSQIHKIINSTLNSINRGYNIASNVTDNYVVKLDINLGIIKKIFKENFDMMLKGALGYDHGMLSALEFITYLTDKEEIYDNYSEVIQDIAYHSPIYDKKINIEENKRLTILILADEIQDWGRPNNYGQMPISKIHPFEIQDNLIICNFIIDDPTNYSLLRQLHGKIENLKRIDLKDKLNVEFKYLYSNYALINTNLFIEDLKALYDYCLKMEDIFDSNNNPHFYEDDYESEEIYYGYNIESKHKLDLRDKLSNYNLNKFILNNKKIWMNVNCNEALITDENVEVIEELKIKGNKRTFNVYLGDRSGNLNNASENDDMLSELKSMIRFINAIIVKITRYLDRPYPYELGIEKFPNSLELNEVYQRVGVGSHFGNLRKISRAVSSNGLFIFS